MPFNPSDAIDATEVDSSDYLVLVTDGEDRWLVNRHARVVLCAVWKSHFDQVLPSIPTVTIDQSKMPPDWNIGEDVIPYLSDLFTETMKVPISVLHSVYNALEYAAPFGEHLDTIAASQLQNALRQLEALHLPEQE